MKRERNYLAARAGMTLIEIMVVIAIMGMMATLITVYFVRQQEQAKVDGTKIQLRNIEDALDAYKIKNGSYPSTEEGLQALVTQEIMKELPKDMWGREFIYIRHNSRSYTLKSLGADGQPGGDGIDADLEVKRE
ncbi:MAG: type II secretion system protein GspG [Deltaproteobacteria bacterium]|nr:MAG: type II secretion system protein GspG [Deltaproteobacteria bacterium]